MLGVVVRDRMEYRLNRYRPLRERNEKCGQISKAVHGRNITMKQLQGAFPIPTFTMRQISPVMNNKFSYLPSCVLG